MLNTNITQASDKGSYIDTARYLNDVELAETLLENGKQNGGKLSYSDIVFSQRNFLKMKYYPVAIKYFFSENELEDFFVGLKGFSLPVITDRAEETVLNRIPF